LTKEHEQCWFRNVVQEYQAWIVQAEDHVQFNESHMDLLNQNIPNAALVHSVRSVIVNGYGWNGLWIFSLISKTFAILVHLITLDVCKAILMFSDKLKVVIDYESDGLDEV